MTLTGGGGRASFIVHGLELHQTLVTDWASCTLVLGQVFSGGWWQGRSVVRKSTVVDTCGSTWWVTVVWEACSMQACAAEHVAIVTEDLEVRIRFPPWTKRKYSFLSYEFPACLRVGE